ncbi:MAG: SH3 domain-containing protein [Treponema sp.]|nr:SH3 domain-containing protein [Treponema sp.]
MGRKSSHLFFFILVGACFFLASCSRMGWGVLLWSTEDPPIPSGTILPVYIRSNIDRVWVVGIPEGYKTSRGGLDKIEIPLTQLELVGSKGKARKQAETFAQYAPVYAQNLQDGLPIRDAPDNGARRVYRLRSGEIIKILERTDGVPAISATGEPLPGDWYKVLTGDGAVGYCFSYRLRLFDHYGGPLEAVTSVREEAVSDPDLDMVLTRVWSPESYGQMFNSRRIDVRELERHWGFDPGQDTGVARIRLPDLERSFEYTSIRSEGERAWRFEGSSLQMNLRTNSSLAVQYIESSGGMRTILFIALPADIDDLIMQENIRREGLFASIYNHGPVFTSNNYGTIIFSENGGFQWTGNDLLVPHVIPQNTTGRGRVSMNLFLTASFEDRYTGACTFYFQDIRRDETPVYFMYTQDFQGLRLEAAPDFTIEGTTVTRRSSSPVVIYFFRDEMY